MPPTCCWCCCWCWYWYCGCFYVSDPFCAVQYIPRPLCIHQRPICFSCGEVFGFFLLMKQVSRGNAACCRLKETTHTSKSVPAQLDAEVNSLLAALTAQFVRRVPCDAAFACTQEECQVKLACTPSETGELGRAQESCWGRRCEIYGPSKMHTDLRVLRVDD